MIKLYRYPAEHEWQDLISRPTYDNSATEKEVRKILEKVKKGGDKAIMKLAKKFDGIKLKRLQVSGAEIEKACLLVSEELKTAIQQAKQNIEAFHSAQKEEVKKIETMPGVVCWRKSSPIERIGLYIPGGTAPLFSTVLMLGVPAQLAGCKEIVLCTPAVHPAVLYAASLCGITKVFKAGGAQAIAAMAYGTETIPKVFKIFGPGNQYVTIAKQLIQQQGVAIDMPAGPSELLVIADETAVPEFIAADLLSQAEHGTDSQVLLITTSERLVKEVENELRDQLKNLTRKKVAEKSLEHSKIILVNSLEEGVAISNLYAPEHLLLCCSNVEEVSKQIINAGSVFLGNYSPESAGDYASGTNHTLPTNGYAAMYSGVSVDSFNKKITYQQLTRQGLENISQTVMVMAEAEGLDAHKNAVAIRLKQQHEI